NVQAAALGRALQLERCTERLCLLVLHLQAQTATPGLLLPACLRFECWRVGASGQPQAGCQEPTPMGTVAKSGQRQGLHHGCTFKRCRVLRRVSLSASRSKASRQMLRARALSPWAQSTSPKWAAISASLRWA